MLSGKWHLEMQSSSNSPKAKYLSTRFYQSCTGCIIMFTLMINKCIKTEITCLMLILLGAICGSAISMDLAAQSMDPYSAQKSMDCAEICGSRRVQSTDLPVLYPDLTLISLLWINIARQVAVGPMWLVNYSRSISLVRNARVYFY